MSEAVPHKTTAHSHHCRRGQGGEKSVKAAQAAEKTPAPHEPVPAGQASPIIRRDGSRWLRRGGVGCVRTRWRKKNRINQALSSPWGGDIDVDHSDHSAPSSRCEYIKNILTTISSTVVGRQRQQRRGSKILLTAAAALWETMTTAAANNGRRHRQGELINMVGDGSGRVGAIPH